MYDITCLDCGNPAEVRTRLDKRCRDCAQLRRRTGSAKRPSKRAKADGGRPRREAEYRNRRWWGIDGEGVNRPDGRHEYVYMAAVAEDGEAHELWHRGRRLETAEILHWLYYLGHSKSDMFAWFAPRYDWGQTLNPQDLSLDECKQLFTPEKAFEFTHAGKEFDVTVLKSAVTMRASEGGEKFFCDIRQAVGGGTFLRFIADWQCGTPAELEFVDRMKDARQTFTDCTPEIRAYCQLECKLLAEGAGKLWRALADEALIPFRSRLYSAGSVAKSMMRNNGVDKCHGTGRYAGASASLIPHIQAGYFGARIELRAPGIHPDPLHKYDLSSAYPYVMQFLPCLEHGHWAHRIVAPRLRRVREAVGIPELALLHWEPRPGRKLSWGPLPYRSALGGITFPRRGTGWYWRSEADAAKLHGDYQVTEYEYWKWEQTCDHKPFAWVPGMYQRRLDLGPDARGKVIKTGLNSAYGTTADSVTPNSKWASAVWSGMITAGCRALVSEQLAAHGRWIMDVATDSIAATRPVMPTDTPGKPLGGWLYEGAKPGVLLVQSGLSFTEDGLPLRARGHSAKALKDQGIGLQLIKAWQDHGPHGTVSYDRHRLLLPRQSLKKENRLGRQGVIDSWGQWTDQHPEIAFAKNAKRPLILRYIPDAPAAAPVFYPVPAGPKDNTPSPPYPKLVKILEKEKTAEEEDSQPESRE